MYKSDRESLRDRRYVTSSAVAPLIAPEHLWNIKTIFTRYDAAVSVQKVFSSKKKYSMMVVGGTLTRLTHFFLLISRHLKFGIFGLNSELVYILQMECVSLVLIGENLEGGNLIRIYGKLRTRS